MRWRGMSRAVSSCRSGYLPARRTTGWRIHQGGSEDVSIDTVTLNMALAKARGTLEFDARQRAYGGHVQIGGGSEAIRSCRSATGRRRSACSPRPRRPSTSASLDALAGVVAIAIERAQFLTERDAAELVRQKADLAATLLASLSHDLKTPLTAIKTAVENLRRRPAAARSPRAGASGHHGARSADAAVPGHPRHGADRCRGDPRRTANG